MFVHDNLENGWTDFQNFFFSERYGHWSTHGLLCFSKNGLETTEKWEQLRKNASKWPFFAIT